MTKADLTAALDLLYEAAENCGGRVPNSFFQAVGHKAGELANEWENRGIITPVGTSRTAALGTVYRVVAA